MVRKLRTIGPSVLVVIVLVGVAAGCGAAQATVTDSSGHQETVSTDAHGITITGADGSNFTIGGGLPADFPKGQVPLVDGRVASSTGGASAGVKSGQKGWVIEIKVARSAASAFSAASHKLTGAGFTKESDDRLGGIEEGTFKSSAYTVSLTSTPVVGSAALLSYAVVPVG